MELTPKENARGTGFSITFRHPQLGLISRGLGTADQLTADAICRDVEALFANADLLQQEISSPIFLAYERRAVEIVFDRKLPGRSETPQALTPAEVGAVADEIKAADRKIEETAKWPPPELATLTPIVKEQMRAAAARNVAAALTPAAYRKQTERIRELERLVKVLQPKCERLEAELARVTKQQNLAVKATVKEALTAWEPVYKQNRKEKTTREGIRYVGQFIDSLPETGKTPLRNVNAGTIDGWIETMTDLSPITKRNRRNAVSVFLGWATRKYDMWQNPMDKVGSIAGVTHLPENIKAIRRISELKDLLTGLEPFPYWRVWVATAILSGPRFREQCYLTTANVFLGEDGDEIRIASRASGRTNIGTKTGRERRIPIERTILLPLLKDWVAIRKEQQVNGKTPAELSPWLFPTITDEKPSKRKLETGIWSSNFVLNWQDITVEIAAKRGLIKVADSDTRLQRHAKLKALKGGPFEYLTFGPDEWRHCFGTVLGMCGWTSLDISRVMGNSSRIAERHYVAATSSGKPWPLEF